jgi:RimJ/RimL family protein N-acetyltransferase
VELRPARLEDFDAWFALFEAVAAERRWVGSEPPLDRDQREAGFRHSLAHDDTLLLLAWQGDRLIGDLWCGRQPSGTAEIGMMVAEGHRGTGVGRALMTACLEWARGRPGIHKLALQVWPHNLAARRLYRSMGFQEEGRLRRHYRRRSGQLWDAVAMGLVLDAEAPGSPYPDADLDAEAG